MYAASYSASQDVSWTFCKSEPDLLKDLTFYQNGFEEKVIIFLLVIPFINSFISFKVEDPKTEGTPIQMANTKQQSQTVPQIVDRKENSECSSLPSNHTSEITNLVKVVNSCL